MKPRRGYFIIELLMTLAIIGVFSLLETRLFNASFRVMTTQAAAAEPTAAFDAAASALRSDVRSAVSFENTKLRTLLVHEPTGETIQWRTTPDGSLTRQAGNLVRVWNLKQPVAIELDGRVVLLRPLTETVSAVAMTINSGAE